MSRSGTSSLLELLPYPGYSIDLELVRGVFCYVLEHYRQDGLSVLLQRQRGSDQLCLRFGDWKGNLIDVQDTATSLHPQLTRFLQQYIRVCSSLLRIVDMPQVQLYLSEDDLLVDVRVSLNKFLGPGMLRDVFGKLFQVPVVRKMETLDDRAISALLAGTGSYSGDLLIKPSRYRWMESPSGPVPLYVGIRR